MKISQSSPSTRLAAAAFAIGLTLGAVGIGGFNLASAQVTSDERPVFIPVDPCRLIDTRSGDKVGGGEILTITAHGSNGECSGASAIPTDALALSLNVTALGATERTFLTLWGGGANPGTSNLNPVPDQPPTPNAVNTPLSDVGNFNLFNAFGEVHVIADVNGYYADHDHDDRYYTEAESDGLFLTQPESDARYYTEAESDDLFLTQAELDARYATLESLPFLAGGTVVDDGGSVATVSGFKAPAGVTASVIESGVGEYSVTLSNTGDLTDPLIQLTGIADAAPGAGTTGATACSLSEAPAASPSGTLVFEVGCFGEDDTNPGRITAEDISFEFIVVG